MPRANLEARVILSQLCYLFCGFPETAPARIERGKCFRFGLTVDVLQFDVFFLFALPPEHSAVKQSRVNPYRESSARGRGFQPARFSRLPGGRHFVPSRCSSQTWIDGWMLAVPFKAAVSLRHLAG